MSGGKVRRFVLGLVVVVSLALTSLAPAVAARGAPSGGWTRPVPGAVLRPFDPPESRFGAGHLGVDAAAPPGTAVVAAGPGVVSFAGSVAGGRHVVVAHADDLRTSYSFLASISVRRGEQIRAGQFLGTTGGRGSGHDGTVLHVGLRRGDTYLDPAALFGPPDLTAVVHLAPTSEPPRPTGTASERRGLLAGLVGAGRAVLHVSAAAFEAGERVLTDAFPVQTAVVRGVRTWFDQRGSCDAHAPPADGEGGSNHRVMLVAGIESSLVPGRPSLALPARELGYTANEITYFSYAPDARAYEPRDTEGPILLAARRLAAQLRALQRREPGREVDLIAHSQGGVVVETFLTRIYDRGDATYPPLGTVVTLAAPHRGAPLADAAAAIRASRTGDDVLQGVPTARTPAVRDLATGSPLMQRNAAEPLPELVDLTTIGSATDLLVPGNRATRPGARHTTLVPHALNAHAGIVRDPAALASVRAALEKRPLPCRSFLATVAGEVVPTVVAGAESAAGRGVAGAAQAVDRAR
jgi:triacylglycerol esterase/lipase EstA (alpha/beta hydrolase family)